MCGFQYVYSLVESECELDGHGYKGYGIRVQNTNTMQSHIYEDVSTSKEKMERLVSLCNRLQLDAIHLEDVLEDMLVELC